MKFRFTHDKKADAMYLYLQRGKKVVRTGELADLLVADLDKLGKVIGIEILCASRQLGKGSSRKRTSTSDMFSMTVPVPVSA